MRRQWRSCGRVCTDAVGEVGRGLFAYADDGTQQGARRAEHQGGGRSLLPQAVYVVPEESARVARVGCMVSRLARGTHSLRDVPLRQAR
jgi:hypothetical protein